MPPELAWSNENTARHGVLSALASSRPVNAVKAAVVAMPLLGFPFSVAAQSIFPGGTWEQADLDKQGWSRAKLDAARRSAHEIGSTAVMIVHDGQVVASWGDVRKKVEIHSVRKSFMSALYGIALARKQIDLNKTLAELGIDDVPPRLTRAEKQATIRDLLTARSGIYHKAAYETRTMSETRPERGSHAPGSFWFYNNWDFNVLGTILRNATGEDTFAAVEGAIARPSQMQDFGASDGHYVYDKASEHPAYTMQFTARDLARFGWLYLNQGQWGDRIVVPAQWVAESTKPYTSEARSGISYGYLWWVSERGKQFRTDTGRGAFSARGAGGQYIVVAPEKRIVIVHLNDTNENEKLESGEFAMLLQRIFAAAPH
jgi:CubicO group peptidase (beta-lactamase class C family)